MIAANGMKKSGTHLLQKYLKRQGIDAVVHHSEFGTRDVFSDHHFIVRNPRNMLMSWVRWYKRPLTSKNIIAGLREYEDGFSMRDYCARFIGWLHDKNTKKYRFEEISSDPSIYGETLTWSGALSNWLTVWSTDVEKAWDASGMSDIEHLLGYKSWRAHK